MLEHAGDVVTREELHQRLWPADTFTDFDHGLNNAINRLREALCDSADKPRFVETLQRRGYRFVAPVDSGVGGQEAGVGVGRGGTTEPIAVEPVGSSLVPAQQGRPQGVPLPEPDGNVAPVPTDAGPVGAVSEPLRQRARPFRLAAVLALLLVGIAVGWFVWHRTSPPSGQAVGGRIESLAVLPFENLSGDKEQEYFADGMTDELITDLGKIGALRVISRTSIMRYKGARKPLGEFARELNVDAVVEGTVLRSGERVRITTQLIRVNPENHLWAESYERDLHNVLGLQEDVAQDIARQIRIKLTPQEQARLSNARPVNPEAHEACLRGVYLWNKRTEQDLQKSIEYFNQAIQKDPSYALPYAGLANAYNSLGVYAHVAPREICPKARAAALEALTLDDTLAEAHAALGFYKSSYEWDQPEADREYRRAIELNPGYALAYVWRGETLSAMERHTEAVAELDRARELDPTSLLVSDQRGWILYMARRYDDVIEQIRKTIELEPRLAHAHCWLGRAYLQKGMLREGLADLQEAASLPGGDSPLFAPWLGYAYALSGKQAEAFKVINAMKGQEQRSFGSPFGIAAIYCGLGEKDQALVWLEKAYQERDPWVPFVSVEPALDCLRSDARFKDLVRRTTLPP